MSDHNEKAAEDIFPPRDSAHAGDAATGNAAGVCREAQSTSPTSYAEKAESSRAADTAPERVAPKEPEIPKTASSALPSVKTLRDEIALKAVFMQLERNIISPETAVKNAFMLADAFMREREKEGK